MAKRDPDKTARNKRINEITEELKNIIDEVLCLTGYDSVLSINAKIGGKLSDFLDIRHEVIYSADQFISLWFQGIMSYLDKKGINKIKSANYELLKHIQENKIVMQYTLLFLERLYLRKFEELSKRRPKPEEAVIWIGQEHANYGILISPRFKNGEWENDGSEIRKFKKSYWTIGHIIETGLVIPNEEEYIKFNDYKEYLNFFKNVIVRNSGSKYEMEIAERYIQYVENFNEPEKVPLLIPEFRYGGLDKKHKYRLDFTIINPYTLEKYGFELSPWSSHGYLSKTKSMTQKQINEIASGNFDKEMKKHKDFFRKYRVFVFVYTSSDLKNIDSVFQDICNFLKPQKMDVQLKIHTLDAFSKYR